MIDEFGFFLGDSVLVKESHPFLGTAFNAGEIFMFAGVDAAIVKFHKNIKAYCYDTEEEFEGTYWYIPLMHLEKLHGGDTELSLLLENEELREKLEYFKQALEISEDLREKLSEHIK